MVNSPAITAREKELMLPFLMTGTFAIHFVNRLVCAMCNYRFTMDDTYHRDNDDYAMWSFYVDDWLLLWVFDSNNS